MDITLALKRAVERYPNGSTVLAAAMDMSPTTLRHKVSPTYDTQFCSPEEMLRLMEVTDDDGPLNALADARGYVLLPLPNRGVAGGDEVVTQLLLDTVREFADVTASITHAVRPDGPGGRAISTNELRQIEAEGAQAIAAIQRLLAWASRSHEEGKPAHLRAVAGG